MSKEKDSSDRTAKIEELNEELIKKNKILKDRAKLLSEDVQEEGISDNYLDIVEFKLSNEIYAVQSKYVSQVSTLKHITPLPCVPSYVLGITSFHEQIISIVDIRYFFEIDSPGITNMNQVIILKAEDENMEFGILADSIFGIRSIPIDSIQTSLATLSDARSKYFFGLTENQTIILDGIKILTDPSIIVK